jgi:hypothetical protein
MTGAKSIGMALPALDKDIIIEGSLQEAIFHLSKNQAELNEMFEKVIMDFQTQLIENQAIVIDSLAILGQEMVEIRDCAQVMAETLIAMNELIPLKHSTKTQDGKS